MILIMLDTAFSVIFYKSYYNRDLLKEQLNILTSGSRNKSGFFFFQTDDSSNCTQGNERENEIHPQHPPCDRVTWGFVANLSLSLAGDLIAVIQCTWFWPYLIHTCPRSLSLPPCCCGTVALHGDSVGFGLVALFCTHNHHSLTLLPNLV